MRFMIRWMDGCWNCLFLYLVGWLVGLTDEYLFLA